MGWIVQPLDEGLGDARHPVSLFLPDRAVAKQGLSAGRTTSS
jgi:hypothetical protein